MGSEVDGYSGPEEFYEDNKDDFECFDDAADEYYCQKAAAKRKQTAGGSGGSSSGSEGCYIATCVYGSYDCPQVWTLRRFRDQVLKRKAFGRLFVRTYYKISPGLVSRFGEKKWFRKPFKSGLDRLVKKLQKKGMSSTPYRDR